MVLHPRQPYQRSPPPGLVPLPSPFRVGHGSLEGRVDTRLVYAVDHGVTQLGENLQDLRLEGVQGEGAYLADVHAQAAVDARTFCRRGDGRVVRLGQLT